MKNNILTYLLILLILPSISFSENLKSNLVNKAYESSSKFTSGWIEKFLSTGGGPGVISDEGLTEVSMRMKDENKPIGTIMILRPLDEQDTGTTFYQAQINSHYVAKDIRQSLNLGLGKRLISEDSKMLLGINSFFDVDVKGNTRVSIGGEYKRAYLDVTGNYYAALLGGGKKVSSNTERVLNGYDLNIIGNIFPWADLVYTNYTWKADQASKNSAGNILSTEVFLNSNFIFEAGFDDNNTNDTEQFAKLSYVYPGHGRYSLQDATDGKTLDRDEDVSKKLLTKVKRSNVITIELEGSGVVMARGD